MVKMVLKFSNCSGSFASADVWACHPLHTFEDSEIHMTKEVVVLISN